jgi:hypothetical protein
MIKVHTSETDRCIGRSRRGSNISAVKSVNTKARTNIRDQNDVDFMHSTDMVGFSSRWLVDVGAYSHP